MKNLIIAEKSSVAADIAKSLGNFKKMGGFFEREDLIITGAVGHLLDLKVPAGQDSGTLPLIPSHFDLEPIEKTADKLELIESLIARRDVGTVINCCDAGREGELIFRYIYSHAGTAKPIKRMWSFSAAESLERSGRGRGFFMMNIMDLFHETNNSGTGFPQAKQSLFPYGKHFPTQISELPDLLERGFLRIIFLQ